MPCPRTGLCSVAGRGGECLENLKQLFLPRAVGILVVYEL